MTRPIPRIFLGWDAPALASAACRLLEPYRDAATADLAGVLVVTPSGRAGRRLTERLVELAEAAGVDLVPPRSVTLAQLADELLPGDRVVAGDVDRELAWVAALRAMDGGTLSRLVARPPQADDAVGWATLARQFDAIHGELAGEGRTLRDAADAADRLAGPDEADRWRALDEIARRCREILSNAGLCDVHTARRMALDAGQCHVDEAVVLLGVADIPAIIRRMIEQGAAECTAMVYAPPHMADRFDALGCIDVAAWADADVPLRDDWIDMAEDPAGQAEAVTAALARMGAGYAPDEVTVGVPDASVVPHLAEQLEVAQAPARYAQGPSLAHTAPSRLLAAVADYLEGRRYADLAALLRHPQVESMLHDRTPAAGRAIELLDDYFQHHVPLTMTGQLIASHRDHVRQLSEIIGHLERWLEPLGEPAKPRRDWPEPVLGVLVEAYEHESLNVSRPGERRLVEALTAIRDELAADHEADAQLDAAPLRAGQAIRLLLIRAAARHIAPQPDDRAVEMLGWLELPLDDAPVLIATGMNDGFVPESVTRDAFLPDGLRAELGVTDNRRRRARDAYALSAAVACREQVHLIAARRNGSGDPLPPSRLLLAADPATIAGRIRRFYPDEPSLRPRTMHAQLGSKADSVFVDWPPPPPAPTTPTRRLPVTAFRDYLRCPYRFYLRHLLGLGAVDDEAVELDPAQFGTLAHHVLQAFGRGPVRHSTSDGEIRNWLDRELDEQFAGRFGQHAAPAMLIQREQLRRRLEAFTRWQAAHAAKGWRIEHTEVDVKDATLPIDGRPITVDGEPFILTGRIDRIDINEAGERLLLDYKTGDTPRKPDETHRRGRRDDKQWIDLQLPLYRHLAASCGIGSVHALGYVVLPRDANEVDAHLADWDASILHAADLEAARIIAKINSGDADAFYPPREGGPFDEFAAICGAELFTRLAEEADGAEAEA